MKHALISLLVVSAPLSAAVRTAAPVRVAPSAASFGAQAGLGFAPSASLPSFSALNTPVLPVLPALNTAISPAVAPSLSRVSDVQSASVSQVAQSAVSAAGIVSAAVPSADVFQKHAAAAGSASGFAAAKTQASSGGKQNGPQTRESLSALASARPSSTGMHFNAFYSGAGQRSEGSAVPVSQGLGLTAAGNSRLSAYEPNPGASAKTPAKPFVYRWGMKSEELPGRTALEKHLAFFDTVGDGSVTVARVFTRLRQLGFSLLEAAVVAPGIQAGIRGIMGEHATKGIWARLNMEVRVADAHLIGRKGTHHIFDKEGNIDAEKLRRLYAKSKLGSYYLPGGKGRTKTESYMTSEMMFALVEENAKAEDPGFAGRTGNRIEWELMFKHFADGFVMEAGKQVPVMTTLSLQKLYDGRLFYEKAGNVEIERSEARKKR